MSKFYRVSDIYGFPPYSADDLYLNILWTFTLVYGGTAIAAFAMTFISPTIEAHKRFHNNAFEGLIWEDLVVSTADFKDELFTVVSGCG